MKRCLFLILSILLLGALFTPPVIAEDGWAVREAGKIYVEADGNSYTVKVTIPITQTFSLLELLPLPDPDIAGNSVVGNWDFLVVNSTLPDVVEYYPYSITKLPFMEVVGNVLTGTPRTSLTTFSISNTTTATAGVGQWFFWKTRVRF